MADQLPPGLEHSTRLFAAFLCDLVHRNVVELGGDGDVNAVAAGMTSLSTAAEAACRRYGFPVEDFILAMFVSAVQARGFETTTVATEATFAINGIIEGVKEECGVPHALRIQVANIARFMLLTGIDFDEVTAGIKEAQEHPMNEEARQIAAARAGRKN